MKAISMNGVILALRAAVYMTGFVLVWAWLAILVRPLDTLLGVVLPAWLPPVGLFFIVLGAALALWCAVLFVLSGRGTPAPFDAPRVFVARGPYRWVRNPMYVGGVAVLMGVALALRSPAIVLLAAVALLLAHVFVVTYEEPALHRRFGNSYDDYRRRVNRWVPRRPGLSDRGG